MLLLLDPDLIASKAFMSIHHAVYFFLLILLLIASVCLPAAGCQAGEMWALCVEFTAVSQHLLQSWCSAEPQYIWLGALNKRDFSKVQQCPKSVLQAELPPSRFTCQGPNPQYL